MSSVAVRTLVRQFLDDESSETIIDMTGNFEDLRTVLSDGGVQPDGPWVGLDFIGDEELPVSLAATNDIGMYREFGQVVLHICAVAKIGIGANLESRAEVLRDLFRGMRLSGMVVESVTPLNTGPGATLEFEAGYVSGTISVAYYFDKILGI